MQSVVRIVRSAVLFALLSVSPLAAGEAPVAPQPRVVDITVQGTYQPDRVVAREGEHLVLHVTRREYKGCTLEIVFPTLGLRVTLPPEQTVAIDLGVVKAGEIPFHCGMKMIHGMIVVEPGE